MRSAQRRQGKYTMREYINLLEATTRPATLETTPLPYDRDALSPVMSRETIEYHYENLAKGYAKRYNADEGDRDFNHPNAELVCDSMERCKQTKVYYSDGKSNKTCIDSIYNHYSNSPQCNLDLLKQFFDENDRLDKIRNIYLRDYIPELEQCRALL
jgi:hypothetical protein